MRKIKWIPSFYLFIFLNPPQNLIVERMKSKSGSKGVSKSSERSHLLNNLNVWDSEFQFFRRISSILIPLVFRKVKEKVSDKSGKWTKRAEYWTMSEPRRPNGAEGYKMNRGAEYKISKFIPNSTKQYSELSLQENKSFMLKREINFYSFTIVLTPPPPSFLNDRTAYHMLIFLGVVINLLKKELASDIRDLNFRLKDGLYAFNSYPDISFIVTF